MRHLRSPNPALGRPPDGAPSSTTPVRSSRRSGVGIALALGLALLGVAGCSALGLGSTNPFDEGASGDQEIRVTIENQNFKDATVWARWNGNRVRVGQVTGNTTRSFDVRYRAPALRFEIDFLAGATHFGDQISVSPGDHVEMTIPPQI